MPRRKSITDVQDNARFVARLREATERFGSVNALAKQAGVSEGALRKWLLGYSEPTRERLVDLARAAGVNLAWLATGSGPKDRSGREDVPLLEGYLLLEWGEEPPGEEAVDVAFSQRWIGQRSRGRAGSLSMVIMPDDSMTPHVPEGALLVVEDSGKSVTRDGIHAFMLGPTLTVRRLQRLPGGELEASAANTAYQPIRFPEDDPRNLLLGRVIWVSHDL
jgi:phage repressor protein C with HTH and peptisase S24 domain